MSEHSIISHQQWIKARQELLQKEKELTRLRDHVSQMRRELPWEKVTKDYVFASETGQVSLAELFAGRSQLIIYHFMFDPQWDEGCKSCSLLADHFNPAIVHLEHRDVSMAVVSKAPIEKLKAFKQRMGWNFTWVSSLNNEFNRDYYVSFTEEELKQNKAYYNYHEGAVFPVAEAPGISVFIKQNNSVFHTYSSYSRGLDMFINAYHLLDITPKGRDEDKLIYSMEWIRHHDRYDDDSFVDPYTKLISK